MGCCEMGEDTVTAERLVRLETKMDFIITVYIQKHEDVETRLKALERWHNLTVGGLIALNVLLTFLAPTIRGLFA